MRRFVAPHNRPYDVFEVLQRLDADILVLPETWVPHRGEGIVDELRAAGYHVELDKWTTLTFDLDREHPRPRKVKPGDGWWALSVATRLPMCARRDLPLRHTILDPAEPRVAIELAVDVQGTPVRAVGLHTSSRLWWGAPWVHITGLRSELPGNDGQIGRAHV